MQLIKEEMEKGLRKDEERRLAEELKRQSAEVSIGRAYFYGSRSTNCVRLISPTLQIIRQHKMKKAMAVFSRLCNRKIQMLLGIGFKQWQAFVLSARLEEKRKASTLIQSHVRQLLARAVLRRMQQEAKVVQDKKARQKKKALKALIEKTERSAIKMQRVSRGWMHGRVVYRRMYKEEQAARVVQRSIRRIRAKRDAWYVMMSVS